jgi:hypothetical protein
LLTRRVRTQIRAHLLHAGFPIANDAAYGGDAAAAAAPADAHAGAAAQPADAGAAAGAANAAADAAADAQAPPDGDAAADDAARFAPRPRLDACSGGSGAAAALGALPAHVGGEHSGEQDALCTHCPWLAPQGQAHDVAPLWLHACRYSGADWRFEAPLPPWAADFPEFAALGVLPEGLWDALPAEALRRAAVCGACGDAA